MASQTTLTAYLRGADRLRNDRSGNPRWTLHTSEGSFPTESGAQINYQITNRTTGEDSWMDQPVTFTLTSRGRVSSWARATDGEN